MQISVIQNALLTLAGNRLLAGKPLRKFWPDASIFVFTQSCRFVDARGAEIAADPNIWLDRIARRSRGLRLHWIARGPDDWLSSGMANQGARWIVETASESCSDLWELTEVIAAREAADRKDWISLYTRIETGWCKPWTPQPGVAEMTAQVLAVTTEAAAFAHEMKITNFETLYRDALHILEHGGPAERTPLDAMLLADLTPEARRLYDGANAAWQFGGMGSWNDFVFDGAVRERYEALTERLYRTLCTAIATAANSTCPAR
ncbi:MAG TPA: hypothetical protein VHZ78_13915 [Rhizomicrobium sp.]|jgi:hypothetical protein|nr:hypothetical protein [Rhizomicrobium sp.]